MALPLGDAGLFFLDGCKSARLESVQFGEVAQEQGNVGRVFDLLEQLDARFEVLTTGREELLEGPFPIVVALLQ